MRLLHALLLICTMLIPTQAFANIVVTHAKSFATATVQKNGAIFLNVENTGDTADKLLSASSNVADSIELHTHLMDGDMMQMRAVEYYAIPARETITLEPMGHHIMLMGLKAPLKFGDSFPLTLNFEHAGEQSVDVQIVKPGDLTHDMP